MARRDADSNGHSKSLLDIRPQRKIEGSSPWTGVQSTSMLNCVSSVTGRGDALLLGTTSDGGAMTLLILSGQTKRRFYESEPEEMSALLDEITEWAKYA